MKELFDRFPYPLIMGVIRSYGIYEHDAEDCFQDLMVKIVKEDLLNKYAPSRGASFATWFTSVLRNFIKMWLRTKKRKDPLQHSYSYDESVFENPSSDRSRKKYHERIGDLAVMQCSKNTVGYDFNISVILDELIAMDEASGTHKGEPWEITEFANSLTKGGVSDVKGVIDFHLDKICHIELGHYARGYVRLFLKQLEKGVSKRTESNFYGKIRNMGKKKRRLQMLWEEIFSVGMA